MICAWVEVGDRGLKMLKFLPCLRVHRTLSPYPWRRPATAKVPQVPPAGTVRLSEPGAPGCRFPE
ncbi:hypothetical protein C7212DRAFT_321154, partial [Tuber magnatum]